MAFELEKILGDSISEGMVVTKYSHSLALKKIKIYEADHPIPDENGVKAVKETLELLKKITEEDVVICLLSGGASALWCDVPDDLTLQDVQITSEYLLRSGATIGETNTVRKHLSAIKGGQLCRLCNGAQLISLIISDVPGDNLEVVASGPTVGDPSTYKDAIGVLERYELMEVVPQPIRYHLEKGEKGILQETVKPNSTVLDNTYNQIIGSNQVALHAAAKKARALGYHTIVNQGLLMGDTEEEAQKIAFFISDYKGERPCCFLQGGETTIKVTGGGKGGRNQHFVLAALQALKQKNEKNAFTILSGGTDGTDGPTDAAGAIADQQMLNLALQKNLSMDKFLKEHDAYHFFEQMGGLLITGPTQTNVMDLVVALVS
jgi:glycerate-2-kinase